MGGGDLKRQKKRLSSAASASALAIGSGLLVLGAPVMAEFRLEPSLQASESYSDNVDRDPDGQRDDALITTLTPGAVLRWTGGRVTASADFALGLQHQTNGDDEGVSVLPDAAGLGSAELWREHLFFDASAGVSTELLNTREQDTESNSSIVQTYSASPRLLGSFGSFADAQTFYRFTQVIDEGGGENSDVVNADVGNAQTHEVGASLTAGTDFSTIRWSLNGAASESDRENDEDVERREVALGLEYIVDRSFSLLGGVGYQIFDDGDVENEVDGITWNAGFRWRPGSRTDISVTYGREDENQSFTADARHQLSAQTRVFLTYDETLETGQERLASNLSFIAVDPNTGQLIDTRTNQPFDAQTSLTTIDEDTQRTRRLTTGISGVRGRNTFGVTGSVEFTRDEGSSTSGEEEDAYQIGAQWSRRLSTRDNLGADVNYIRREFQSDGRQDNEYSVGVNYTYNIYQNVNAFGAYEFAIQTSDNEADEFYENFVTVGLGVRF